MQPASSFPQASLQQSNSCETLEDCLEQLKCFEASEMPCSHVWLPSLFLLLLKPLISVHSFDLRFQIFHSTIESVVNLFPPFLSFSTPEQVWSSLCSCSGERRNRSVERILWSSTVALPSPANSASLMWSCQVRPLIGVPDRLSWVSKRYMHNFALIIFYNSNYGISV